MRKLLLVMFTLVIGSTYTYSQSIDMDKTDEHGDRYIYCSFESIRSMMDKYMFFVSLNAAQNGTNKEDVIYSIILRTNATAPLSVPKDGRLLIKLMDDSIIELKTEIEYSDNVGEVRTGSIVYTAYSIFPSFVVTPEQIALISKGVKKIRLETTLDPIDKEYKKDKMGKIIKAEYNLINQALSQTKSFSDDF